MKFTVRFLAVPMVLTLLASCGGDTGTEPGNGLEPTLSSIQTVILTPRCVNAGCHPGGGAPMSLEAGQSYNSLVNKISTGYAPLYRVLPNSPDISVLYLKVIGDPATGPQMPLGRSPLSSAETEIIREWIQNGAEDN